MYCKDKTSIEKKYTHIFQKLGQYNYTSPYLTLKYERYYELEDHGLDGHHMDLNMIFHIEHL